MERMGRVDINPPPGRPNICWETHAENRPEVSNPAEYLAVLPDYLADPKAPPLWHDELNKESCQAVWANPIALSFSRIHKSRIVCLERNEPKQNECQPHQIRQHQGQVRRPSFRNLGH